MKKQPLLIGLVALVTLGSGLVNVYSVIGPGLPERMALLRRVFPLEFIHLARFLTLLIGLALIVSSLNIYKRKRRAFQLVVPLAVLSIAVHLSKGLDYEEALFSLALLVALLLTRRSFTVKSSRPDLRGSLVRLGVAFLVAVGYGEAGFWLLDPRQFGIDFNWSDALQRTVLMLSLVGDPTLVPHTRYANWFLDSLSLMTLTVIGYAAFTLFRPVLYEFRIHPQERTRAREIVRTHGRSAMDYFKLWPDKSFFFLPEQEGFLAYRVGGSFAVVLGDPVGPETAIEPLVRGFSRFCAENDWGVGFHQTLPDFLEIYSRAGFRKLKIGDDAIVDLAAFKLEGKAKKDIRHTLNLLERTGVRTAYYEPPLPDEVYGQVKEVSDEWLQIPGRRERGFTLGWFEPSYVRSTPVFAALNPEGRMLAFVNMVPSYRAGEATVDLMRRRAVAPNGVMDFLFVKLFLHQRERGFRWFSLGMAPMAGFQEGEEASPEERAIHYFLQQLNFLFSFKGLREYKAKFASRWEPRYAVYRHPLDLPRLAMALRKVSEFKE